ncbi:MAG: gamma-glutamyl-gamma-aminobutyrate hydrolase family protein [Candidatus Acidiferrum sp.]
MSIETDLRPRVGIPWRTSEEEVQNNRPRIANYEEAVRKAGGEPVLIPLRDRAKQEALIPALDAFVLPGSPADVEPAKYGEVNHGKSAPADLPREQADEAILAHAFAEKKPVLAICYGCQLLNVYLGGTLIQDVREELGTTTPHRKKDVSPEAKDDPVHGANFDATSRLAGIASGKAAQVNSSHHQAIKKPGENLRVTAHSADGIIEGVEWSGDSNWVVGVQWHPERMFGDVFSERLFRDFVAAARGAAVQKA